MITESPIEEKFAAAVRTYDGDGLTVLPSSDVATLKATFYALGNYGLDGNRADSFACAPQVQIGPYRTDFCFIADCVYGEFLLVAVECDGHEFHERTKEQAAHDRSRDRAMTRAGIHVMRFTGSEIHRDAEGCFQEVYDYLMDKHTAGVNELWRRMDLERRETP